MRRATALWALAALCGIFVAGGIGWATSRLTNQHIGLSSEPLGAVTGLAPPAPAPATAARPSRAKSRTSKTTKTPAPSVPSETVPSTVQSTPSAEPAPTVTSGAAKGGTGSGGNRDDHEGGGQQQESGGQGATQSAGHRDD